jgi:hypothetical protein
VDSEDPGFAVTASELNGFGALIVEGELGLVEAYLPDIVKEMLLYGDTDAED